ncbi:hypothetical protein [Filimonas effusa]|uniref:Uncharacterized protein n=1 Tax=Filimonas effusa TaxID=2508721 RepID=A0A4Q1DCM8_9BACT|nr:hypothetical protein [Filimonas effusa]RXK87202.1 hypothetical protein ESB13_10595 [Filimonas effusa]
MNFIDKSLLRISLLPAGIYRKMGVDTFQLKSIVTTKLILDDRRPSAIRQWRKDKGKKSVKSGSIKTFLFNLLLGFMFMGAMVSSENPQIQLVIFFTMFMAVIATMLMSDFSTMLMDPRDNYIILPKPVNDKTILTARLVHIFIHLCRTIIPITFFSILVMFVEYGWYGGLVFLLLIPPALLLTLFSVNMIYLVVLKFSSGRRFQTYLTVLQVIMGMALYFGYQVISRKGFEAASIDINLSSYPGMLAAPPYWFATTWQAIAQFKVTGQEYIAAALGLVLPFAGIYIVMRWLAPSFGRKLAAIHSGDGETSAPAAAPVTTAKASKKTGSFVNKLAKLITSSRAEQMSFVFVWKITARSKEFMLKVYPAFGYMAVWIIYLIWQNKNITVEKLQDLSGYGKLLIIFVVYGCSMLLFSALSQIAYSEKYKASWIYHVTPLEKPGTVISGSVKAIVVRFFLPVVVITFIPLIAFIGPAVIPNLLLGLSNQLLIAGCRVYIPAKDLPLSLKEFARIKGGSTLRAISTLIFPLFIGGLHYLVFEITPLIYLLLVLSAAAAWYIFDSIKNTGWHQVRMVDGNE